MKKIDFKSFLIGILSTLLCLLLLGSNSQKIISDEIICKKIIIKNDDFKDRIILSTDENGGKLQIKNKYGELINSLGASKNGNGFFHRITIMEWRHFLLEQVQTVMDLLKLSIRMVI